jgi:glutathione S-transferase
MKKASPRLALQLYINGIGSCAVASHIALEEAGANYAATKLDYSKVEQRSAEYLEINPKGRVPSLVTNEGVITETPAILFYIGQTFPEANLIPNSPYDIARMQDFNSYLCSTVHPNHAHEFRGNRWSDDPVVIEGLKVKVRQNVLDNYAVIENRYFKGPWLLGPQFTISDIYLFTLATWLDPMGIDIAAFSKVSGHQKIMYERPAVKRVLASYN